MELHRFFFALLLLFLPTQLGFHFWPDWAMVLGRRVDYLAPTIFLTDIFIFLTVGCWLISRVIQWVRGNPKSKFLSQRLISRWLTISKQILRFKSQMFKNKYLLTIALVVLIIVNIFIAVNQMVAVYKWLKIVEFILLGWYIVRTKPSFSTVVIPLSTGVFYSSVFAIAQFIFQHSLGGPLWWFGERTFSIDTPGIARFNFCQLSTASCQLLLRPYGTFPHPNVLGGFLAVTLPLLLNLQMKEKMTRVVRWFFWITLVFGLGALALTFSRSAWMVELFVIVYGIWKSRITTRKKFFLFTSCLLLTVVFVVRLTHISLTDESVVVRQQLSSAAFSVWQRSPLLGVGLGNFLVELPKTLPSKSVYFLQPVHNIYLLVLAETGVVGFVFFCWLLWKALWSYKHTIHQPEKLRTGSSQERYIFSLNTVHYSLCTLLLLGFVDHYPLSLQQGQLFLTLLIALSIVN